MPSKLKLKLFSDERLETAARTVSVIAHDYNNTLAAIEAYTALLLAAPDVSSQAAADLGEINRAAGKAAELNRKLLVFSRRKIPGRERTDMGLFLKKIFPELIKNAKPAVLKLSAENTGKEPVNTEQLKELVVLLLRNAAEAVNPAGGLIRLSVKKTAAGTEIKISDNGAGIEKEHAARLFEPFFTTKPKKEGLGLAMVYGISRRHSAEIRVESEQGRGTEFRITLGKKAQLGGTHE